MQSLAETLSYSISHPLNVVVLLSFFAAALAAFAWGRPGAITAFALAPLWGASLAAAVTVMNWEHFDTGEVVKTFLVVTAIWIAVVIPATLMGLAIRSLKNGRSRISKET